MAYNVVPEEPTLIVIIVNDGDSSTALEHDLAGQKFSGRSRCVNFCATVADNTGHGILSTGNRKSYRSGCQMPELRPGICGSVALWLVAF